MSDADLERGPVSSRRRFSVEWGALTHKGLVRVTNEDCFFVGRFDRMLQRGLCPRQVVGIDAGLPDRFGHLLGDRVGVVEGARQSGVVDDPLAPDVGQRMSIRATRIPEYSGSTSSTFLPVAALVTSELNSMWAWPTGIASRPGTCSASRRLAFSG